MREMADINVSINKKASLELPEKVDSNVGKTLVTFANAIKDITCASKNVVNATIHGTATLFAPLKAICEGKAAELEEKYAYKAEEYRKLKSNLALGIDVLKNLNDKEQNGEKIPDKIEDTDTLFSIQEAASETLDKDFISFWAKLYTEEACKPNCVSKRTISICKNLDKNIVSLLEQKIFPYASNDGWLAYYPNCVDNLFLLKDYGFLDDLNDNIFAGAVEFEKGYPPLCRDSFGEYWLWVHPGFLYKTPFRLTFSGREIRNALKIYPKEKDISFIGNELEKISKDWKIDKKYKFSKQPSDDELFVITDNSYPPFLLFRNEKYKKFEEYWIAIRNNVVMEEKK